MTRLECCHAPRAPLGVLLAIALLGCGVGADADARAPADTSGSQTAPTASPPPEPPAADSASIDPGSADAAAAVIRDYYRAIDARDFAAAYALWSDSGRASGQTFDAFRAGYEGTTSVNADIGTPGRIEGAAGSRYIEIPVTIRATESEVVRQCFRGTYTLRRAVVDGATEAQRAWHISDAEIVKLDPDGCVADMPRTVEDSAAAVLVAFGDRLAKVSVLAPPDVLRPAIREQYGDLVTEELLARWLAQPADAPGRETSSPWPARVRVETVEVGGDGAFAATGLVCYQTSTSLANGACAPRRAFSARVVRVGQGFRIADFRWQEAGPAPR